VVLVLAVWGCATPISTDVKVVGEVSPFKLSNMKFIVLALLFASVFCLCSALDCFQCNQFDNKKCMDEFDKDSAELKTEFLKPCPTHNLTGEAATYCKKMKMWFDLTGDVRVDRTCGYNKREIDGPCYQTRADDHIVDTCMCDGEGCNSASVPATSAAALVAAIIMAIRA